MNRDEYRQFLLSGAISFPATLPDVAQLQLRPVGDLPLPNPGERQRANQWLVTTTHPSPRVTMRRSVLLNDVRAVFLPHNVDQVRFEQGLWFLGSEVSEALAAHLQDHPEAQGIVYVAESSPSLLEVSAGMTAGESIQYYPPLPCDRANNHYDALAGNASAAYSLKQSLGALPQSDASELAAGNGDLGEAGSWVALKCEG